jgi:hypothetical protein
VLHRLSGIETFAAKADRFEAQLNNRVFRMRALAGKALFKLRNY